MRTGYLYVLYLKIQSLAARNLKTVGDPHIIWFHPQKSCHNGLVSAMSSASRCKRTVKADTCTYWPAAQQCPGNIANSGGACCMGAGRPYHDRPQNIKNVHNSPLCHPLFILSPKNTGQKYAFHPDASARDIPR